MAFRSDFTAQRTRRSKANPNSKAKMDAIISLAYMMNKAAMFSILTH